MFNRICKVVIAIALVCGLLFGIYKILPSQYSNKIDMTIQQMIDKNAKDIVFLFQQAKVQNTKVTYKELFDTNAADPSWYVKEINVDENTHYGTYQININGYKMTLSLLKDDGSGDTLVHTNAHVEVILTVTHTETLDKVETVDVYIDGDLQNDHYKKEFLTTLAGNVQK